MSTIVALLLIGAAFTVLGLVPYLGLWRSWAETTRPNIIFPWLYLGVAAICGGVFGALADTALAGFAVIVLLVGILAGAVFVGTIIIGMPRWMLPRWYRVIRGR
ncbi:hypothetical protein [Curtobacterium sp. Leaf261]|uniref:hypothetical protein n=1 Tax=Curtobacterium sp. Leaf261 TaxID=1736311 RepID=UPI00070172DB|nr:hypothetical protein [Curtobacterium sp. Leaf261]KQO65188.1 hypothetical protein ASF23_03500 [Curtobacterium sp. Leaf261]